SEYPSIMTRFNISPETINCPCCPDAPRVPELGYRVCRMRRGITSRVVERLIAKRGELKKLYSAAQNLSRPGREDGISDSSGHSYSVIPSEARNLSGFETEQQRDSSAR